MGAPPGPKRSRRYERALAGYLAEITRRGLPKPRRRLERELPPEGGLADPPAVLYLIEGRRDDRKGGR